MKSAFIAAAVLALAGAALPATPVLAQAGPAPKIPQVQFHTDGLDLPPLNEFREGDHYAVFDPAQSQRTGQKVSIGLKKENGKWVGSSFSIDDFINNKKVERDFKDLRIDGPRFPADHAHLFAASDGSVWWFLKNDNRWSQLKVGSTLTSDGRTYTIRERMIPADVARLDALVFSVASVTPPAAPQPVQQPGQMPKITVPIPPINVASPPAAPAKPPVDIDAALKENLALAPNVMPGFKFDPSLFDPAVRQKAKDEADLAGKNGFGAKLGAALRLKKMGVLLGMFGPGLVLAFGVLAVLAVFTRRDKKAA